MTDHPICLYGYTLINEDDKSDVMIKIGITRNNSETEYAALCKRMKTEKITCAKANYVQHKRLFCKELDKAEDHEEMLHSILRWKRLRRRDIRNPYNGNEKKEYYIYNALCYHTIDDYFADNLGGMKYTFEEDSWRR